MTDVDDEGGARSGRSRARQLKRLPSATAHLTATVLKSGASKGVHLPSATAHVTAHVLKTGASAGAKGVVAASAKTLSGAQGLKSAGAHELKRIGSFSRKNRHKKEEGPLKPGLYVRYAKYDFVCRPLTLLPDPSASSEVGE